MIYKLINAMSGGPEKEIGLVSVEGMPDVVCYDGELYKVIYRVDNAMLLIGFANFPTLRVFNEIDS